MPPKRSVISANREHVAMSWVRLLASRRSRAAPRKRGAESAARPIAHASSAAATPTKAAVISRGLRVLRDDAAEPVVDGAEPRGVGDCECLAAGLLGDRRERLPVGRNGDDDRRPRPG